MLVPWEKFPLEDRRLLEIKYAEKHRVYHNRPHPCYVYEYSLELWNRYGNNRDCNKFFQHTAAYHDFYYDVKAKDNEARSAQAYLASQVARERVEEFQQRVATTIIASSDHCALEHADLPLESRIFLDADLYELGSPYDLFAHNTQCIIDEFRSEYSDMVIFKGRLDWYRAMLYSPQIFWVATDREAKARENIRRGIEEMEKLIEDEQIFIDCCNSDE